MKIIKKNSKVILCIKKRFVVEDILRGENWKYYIELNTTGIFFDFKHYGKTYGFIKWDEINAVNYGTEDIETMRPSSVNGNLKKTIIKIPYIEISLNNANVFLERRNRTDFFSLSEEEKAKSSSQTIEMIKNGRINDERNIIIDINVTKNLLYVSFDEYMKVSELEKVIKYINSYNKETGIN